MPGLCFGLNPKILILCSTVTFWSVIHSRIRLDVQYEIFEKRYKSHENIFLRVLGVTDYESEILEFLKFNMADQVAKSDLEERYSSVFEIAVYKSGVGKAKLQT